MRPTPCSPSSARITSSKQPGRANACTTARRRFSKSKRNGTTPRHVGVFMKPVVLSLGLFPPATMTTLAERFELHHFTVYPLPEGTLSPEVTSVAGGNAQSRGHG